MCALSGHRLVPMINSGNFNTWKTEREILVIQEGPWGIVSSKRTTPATSSPMDQWHDRAEKATATIHLYVVEHS